MRTAENSDEHAPDNLKTTAQGLFGATVFGVGMATGGFFGGVLLESLGGQGMFAIFGAVVMGVTLIAALIKRGLLAEKLPDKTQAS